ncbi:hypothetical protein WG906_04815 [Pedobacter sp. P351]|uniref:hypothetical protein n=1 Tax=Pedobacter superstes TaxID=3133441 RepID=UPI00309DE51B
MIEKEWMDLLEQIDPDIIYHSKSLNPRELEKCGLKVYPRTYSVIPENGILNLSGVNPFAFIDHFFKYQLAERRQVSLPYFINCPDHILKNFLSMNFGVRELYVEDDGYLQEIGKVGIYSDNIDKALSLMWSQSGFMQNLLCECYLGNEILRPERWQAEQFELIIYDEDQCFDDLIYYWNRRLYQSPSMKLRQIAVSNAEFELLANDPFFHQVLSHNAGQNNIYVTSRSLTAGELLTITSKSDPKNFRVSFKILDNAQFPEKYFQVDQSIHQAWIKTLLQGNEGFIFVPEYPIGDHIRLHGQFELDIRINNSGSSDLSEFRFPYYSLLRRNVSDIPARVNKYNALTFHVDSIIRGIDLRLPPVAEVLLRRVQIRDVAGNIERPIGLLQCKLSGAGLYLSAFMKLFSDDWWFVQRYVLDKFWLEIFTGTGRYQKIKQAWQLDDQSPNTAITNSITPNLYGKLDKGDGLFSYKDLQHELKCIYNFYSKEIGLKGEDKEEGYVVQDKNAFICQFYQKDVESILYAVSRFVEVEAIFIGLKVKCYNCGSNLWYSLKELSHRMTCRGCSFGISPPPESTFYYKVNDTVLNNLMSDPVKRKKAYGGNYVVLKILDHLRDPFCDQMTTAFGYSPSLDIYVSHDDFQKTDLDIVAIQDGKFIVGEAKMNFSDFDQKQIKQLIWIGNEIRPDVVLLAYKDGKVSQDILDKVQRGITWPHVEVRAQKIAESKFLFGAMLGLPEIANH